MPVNPTARNKHAMLRQTALTDSDSREAAHGVPRRRIPRLISRALGALPRSPCTARAGRGGLLALRRMPRESGMNGSFHALILPQSPTGMPSACTEHDRPRAESAARVSIGSSTLASELPVVHRQSFCPAALLEPRHRSADSASSAPPASPRIQPSGMAGAWRLAPARGPPLRGRARAGP
jgi:hypothetical protein